MRPTLRIKRRYIIVRFHGGGPENARRWAIAKLMRLLGIWGYHMARVRVVSEKPLILSVERSWADIVAGALLLGREDFVPETIIAGTLEAARRKGFL